MSRYLKRFWLSQGPKHHSCIFVCRYQWSRFFLLYTFPLAIMCKMYWRIRSQLWNERDAQILYQGNGCGSDRHSNHSEMTQVNTDNISCGTGAGSFRRSDGPHNDKDSCTNCPNCTRSTRSVALSPNWYSLFPARQKHFQEEDPRLHYVSVILCFTLAKKNNLLVRF